MLLRIHESKLEDKTEPLPNTSDSNTKQELQKQTFPVQQIWLIKNLWKANVSPLSGKTLRVKLINIFFRESSTPK